MFWLTFPADATAAAVAPSKAALNTFFDGARS
jgi:hypothetical protein